jgi:predicted RND superfamily exporter protein
MRAVLERAVFAHRTATLVVLALMTCLLASHAVRLGVDAGFEKRLPLSHPYMRTFVEYRDSFGGANHLLIAVRARSGDIFTPAFFATLEQVTEAVFFLPGVDRSRIRSLFTPNVRFIEIVEGGFAGGNVVPADFRPTPEGLAEVRRNILAAGLVGRLVADDFSAALISAELVERDPTTGQRLDYLAVAERLERTIRAPFVDQRIDIHILGFAKAMGDIAAGARSVILLFGVTFVTTAALIWLLMRSLALTFLPLACSLLAVLWTLGLLSLAGLALDPISILLPFLIFAIATSHGMQMIGAYSAESASGADRLGAARRAFRRLLVPGSVALASDLLGFLAIVLIAVRLLQDLAVAAALGVALVALTNLLLLPILLSYFGPPHCPAAGGARLERLLRALAAVATPRRAALSVLVALALLAAAALASRDLRIGDLQPGLAELRPDARYNRDSAFIASHFAIGVDVLQVIVEAAPDACVDHAVMSEIDRFQWHMANLPGVRSTLSLPQLAKTINAGWNEGSLKWHVLPRHQSSLAQAIAPIETSSGLLNADCSAMPVLIFTDDHRARTIARVIDAVKAYQPSAGAPPLAFRLAAGNLAVLAATNEVVAAAQIPIVLYIYAAIVVLCALTFRSLRAVVCIVLPIGLVSLLVYALMALLGIGLKLSTLPVAALAVGIGVDYGIYLYARLAGFLRQGLAPERAWLETLRVSGRPVLLTGLTLALGVAPWLLSPLKLQGDMGILLGFAFIANLLGALLLLPALAALTLRIGR